MNTRSRVLNFNYRLECWASKNFLPTFWFNLESKYLIDNIRTPSYKQDFRINFIKKESKTQPQLCKKRIPFLLKAIFCLQKLLVIISPIAWEQHWKISSCGIILRASGESDIEKIQEIKLGKWKLIEFSGLSHPTGE